MSLTEAGREAATRLERAIIAVENDESLKAYHLSYVIHIPHHAACTSLQALSEMMAEEDFCLYYLEGLQGPRTVHGRQLLKSFITGRWMISTSKGYILFDQVVRTKCTNI